MSDRLENLFSEEGQAFTKLNFLVGKIVDIVREGRPIPPHLAAFCASVHVAQNGWSGHDEDVDGTEWQTMGLPSPDWIEGAHFGSDVAEIVRQMIEVHPKALIYVEREAQVDAEVDAKILRDLNEKHLEAIRQSSPKKGPREILLNIVTFIIFCMILLAILKP